LSASPVSGRAEKRVSAQLKAAGVSLRSVQRIQAHQLSQHRMRTFKLSTDPKFAETCPARRRKVIEVARRGITDPNTISQLVLKEFEERDE
jgi:hypothetical protein